MKKPGISILLRAGNDKDAAKKFLDQFINVNTFSSIEVIVLFNEPNELHIQLIKEFAGKLRLSILPANRRFFQKINQRLSYQYVCIIDTPSVFTNDIFSSCFQFLKINNERVFLKYQANSVMFDKSAIDVLDSIYMNISRVALERILISKGYSDIYDFKESSNSHSDKEIGKPILGQEKNHNITITNNINRAVTDSLDSYRYETNSSVTSGIPQKSICNTSFIQSSKFDQNDNFEKKETIQSINHIDNKKKIIAGMASISERKEILPEVIGKILPQVDHLFIYLNGYHEVPSFLINEKVTVFMSKYHGDIAARGKFYNVDNVDKTAYYFSLDDDFLYPENYVERMIASLKKYNGNVIVTVHGSVFGDPLNWYFERTKVFGSKEKLNTDKFVNLVGTATFACDLEKFPLSFSDFYPSTMCDLQVSIKARQREIPAVAIRRRKGWLKTIKNDPAASAGTDYWTQMLLDDRGRSKLAKKFNWSFHACKDYIVKNLLDTFKNLDEETIRINVLDGEFLNAYFNNKKPRDWDPSLSQLYHIRKLQYLLKNQAETKTKSPFEKNINKTGDDYRKSVLINLKDKSIVELKEEIKNLEGVIHE